MAFDRSETQLVAARGQGISVARSATEAACGRTRGHRLPAGRCGIARGYAGSPGDRSGDGTEIRLDRNQHRERGSLGRGRYCRPRTRCRLSARAGVRKREHRSHGSIDLLRVGPAAMRSILFKPLLTTFTRVQTYLGAGEEARYAKLAVNLMIAASAAMMAESLALARKGGIAWQDILAVFDDSAIASPMVKYKTAPLRSRDWESTFSCRQMAKDLDLILAAGHAVGVPLQLAAQVRETYASADRARRRRGGFHLHRAPCRTARCPWRA